jgi:SSS family solute:Na+ symporter
MTSHLFAAVFVIITVLLIVFSMRTSSRVKSAGDFAVANRNLDSFGVSWAIIGTLVGGASMIGTVEMAYKWGLAGWYFTLGSIGAWRSLWEFFRLDTWSQW